MKLCILLLFCTLQLFALSQDEAIQKALKLQLYSSKQWLDLLHFNGRKSEIDSADFFYAPNGHRDPKAELIATIKAFYQEVDSVVVPQDFIQKISKANTLLDSATTSLPKRSVLKEDYHALCRFPARFFYLNSILNFDSLPHLECDEFNTMRAYINPKSASLIFPSAHINSPASMFGHTFLLLNSSFDSRLLAFALNYQAAADPKVENAFIFTFKGLFGLYSGQYSLLPYYDKIKEYVDVENRDIWEFDLNLTQEEIAQMYRHIWELSDSTSAYYFFHRNCSYNILWLLEVARPNLRLRQQFAHQVNPPETLFVIQNAHLITKETYRPSKRSKLLAYEKKMRLQDVIKAKKVARGKLAPQAILDNNHLSLIQKQYILESSLEMSEYWYMKSKLTNENYTSIIYESASARSKLGESEAPQIPQPRSPLYANQGLRISPMYVLTQDSSGYTTQGLGLDFRLTFHDISDNDIGYLKGAQIELLKVLAHTGLDSANNSYAKIHSATIFSIASFGMISKFFTPLSYRIDTGFSRQFLQPELRYYLAPSIGATFSITRSGYVYYLLEPTLYLNALQLPRFALSNVFGLVLGNDKRTKLALEYKLKGYDIALFGHYISATTSFNLWQNLGLFLTLESNILPREYPSHYALQSGLRIYF